MVPTVHPVGPIGAPAPSIGFSSLYREAFVGIDFVNARPLPKSKYVESPFGFVQPTFAPSQMNSAAYLHWMTKLSRPKGVHMTSLEYARALEILKTEFSPFLRGGVSTVEEVLPDISWDKSPGWPYVNQGCTTKRDAWDKFGDVIVDRANRLIRGEYVECIFIASLKDELLPPGKNPRVFLPAPFHHQLACAMLFKKASDDLTNSCHQHSSAVGVNIFGKGLERGLRALKRLPDGYDADRSGCDTSWKDSEPERDFMKTGLPPSTHAGVDMLFNTAMCPRVIVADRVLQLETNPSGWYLTTWLNTLGTHRDVAGAYMDLHPGCTIAEMRSHLAQWNGGDDLAYSTDSKNFGIVELANELSRRGVYLESDVLTPRDPMTLTFFSHILVPRKIDRTNTYVYAACGRLSKMLSAFSYLKISEGKVDWQRNASRVIGLMVNLWPFKREFDSLYPYLYHLIHHFFLLDGQKLTPEWSGVFKSIPTDDLMMILRNGNKFEGSSFFSPPKHKSSFDLEKRVFQSALRNPSPINMSNKQVSNASMRNIRKRVKPSNQAVNKEKAIVQEELKALRATSALLKKQNVAAATTASSHVEAGKKKSLGTYIKEGAQKAGKFLKDHGLETLITLGAALLDDPHIQSQLEMHNKGRRNKGLSDLAPGVIPAGTILGSIFMYPNFASDLDPNAITRLQRKASTFLRYRFEDTYVNFTPAAGALNNGQIGYFIASDPRYIITETGEAATRLVHEFQGNVTQISQKSSLKVPRKEDWLFVENSHESDTRFTQQGVLWILAYTDLVLGDNTNGSSSSLGDFSLNYNIALKDDSIEGASIAPISSAPSTIFKGTFSNQVEGDPSFTTYLFSPYTQTDTGSMTVEPVVDQLGVTNTTKNFDDELPQWCKYGGLFQVSAPGYYRIHVNFCADILMSNQAGNMFNLNFCKTGSGNIDSVPFVGANYNTSVYRNATIVSVTFYQYLYQNDSVYFYLNNVSVEMLATVSHLSNSIEFTLTGPTTGSVNADLRLGTYKPSVFKTEAYKQPDFLNESRTPDPATPPLYKKGVTDGRTTDPVTPPPQKRGGVSRS